MCEKFECDKRKLLPIFVAINFATLIFIFVDCESFRFVEAVFVFLPFSYYFKWAKIICCCRHNSHDQSSSSQKSQGNERLYVSLALITTASNEHRKYAWWYTLLMLTERWKTQSTKPINNNSKRFHLSESMRKLYIQTYIHNTCCVCLACEIACSNFWLLLLCVVRSVFISAFHLPLKLDRCDGLRKMHESSLVSRSKRCWRWSAKHRLCSNRPQSESLHTEAQFKISLYVARKLTFDRL